MSLILPPHLRAAYRPLRGYSTIDLMQELHWRDVLHELSGSQAMDADPAVWFKGGGYESLRQLTLAELLKQMGVAIASSGRALLLAEQTPDPTTRSGIREILHAKVIVCKHPKLDPANAQEMIWNPVQQAVQPAPEPMEPTPASPTSSPSNEEPRAAQDVGPANTITPSEGTGS